jgi:hypothetical protein
MTPKIQSELPMVVSGTWKITITLLNKAKMPTYSERRGQWPRKGEILEKVVAGRLIKAEIETFQPSTLAAPSIWTIEATEI